MPIKSLSSLTSSSNKPAFLAQMGNVSNVTGDGTAYDMVFGTETIDSFGDYNPSTGLFTAPVVGLYSFQCNIAMHGVLSSHANAELYAIRSVGTGRGLLRIHPYNMYGGNPLAFSAAFMLLLAAGETVNLRIVVTGGTNVIGFTTSSTSYFSGYLVK